MPELPEVTTTVNGLKETVVGKQITDVWTDWPRTIKTPSFPSFRKKLVGKRITGVERCGKNILVHLSEDFVILVHMKMTGHFLYGKYEIAKNRVVAPAGPLSNDPYNKYVHLLFILSGKKSLGLSDARKFAKVKLFSAHELSTCDDLKNLGPDALSVSQKEFRERLLRRPRGKIKQVLLDQTIIAGVGNIYSDEMLWLAGVHPLRTVEKILPSELRALHVAMRNVLRKGIKFNGDSDSDYRNVYGERGNFQHHHNVYRRTGKPCPKNDRGAIKRIVVGGRSAHFCPIHQK